MKRTTITMLLILTSGILLSPVLCNAAKEVFTPAQVRITTDPTGASVSLNSTEAGISPVTITNLPAGNQLIVVRKDGFTESRRTIKTRSAQKSSVDIKLDPVLGLLIIHSSPDGCEVNIDGADQGKTPILLTDLTIGKHRAVITKQGRTSKTLDITISDRTPQKINVTLASDAAKLQIDSVPDGARVMLDGINKGTTPCTVETIQAGHHKLEITKDGYEPYILETKFQAGQTEKLEAILNVIPPELKVVTIPAGARIYIDNQFKGESPVTLNDLKIGEHRIRAEMVAFQMVARSVTLEPADKIVEEFRLSGNSGTLTITTEPAGVEVFIDGKKIGATAAKKGEADTVSEIMTKDMLTIGSHEIQLSKKGYYEGSFSIEIQKNKKTTVHKRLKRRFIPDCQISTRKETFEGVLIGVDPDGNVKLEVRPGIIKTFEKNDITIRRPLKKNR